LKKVVTYLRTSSWNNQSSVDSTLLTGKTIASRDGGLGYFQFVNNGITKYVGDYFSGVATNSTINFYITFKPVTSGTYNIYLYRDNKAQLIYSTSGSFSAGSSYTRSGSFTYPGGTHYYYLYISGPDYIYSSPIVVSN